MTEEKLKTILADQSYINQLLSAETSEELYSLLTNKQINISSDDAHEIFLHVSRYKSSLLQKLDDNELGKLSGSNGWSSYAKVVSTVPYYTGYIIGKAPAIGLVIYSMIKGAKDQLKGDL